MKPWRVIVDGAGVAAVNMATDEAIFRAVASNNAPPTIRLYHWERPALTLGRFQSLARTMNTNGLQASGLPVVRRLTGGRGILHGDDLTISVCAPVEALGLPETASIATLYERLGEGYIRAFQTLGIEAGQGGCRLERGVCNRGNCFDIISSADIIDRRTGCKLLGSALYRNGKWIMQQASLPLNTSRKIQHYRTYRKSIFWPARADSIQNSVAGNGGFSPSTTLEELNPALVTAMAETLDFTFDYGGASDAEHAHSQRLIAERYACQSWNDGMKGSGSGSADNCARDD